MTAKNAICQIGDIARTINPGKNAASGTPYQSSNCETSRYINDDCHVSNNDSITKHYGTIYAHAILFIVEK